MHGCSLKSYPYEVVGDQEEIKWVNDTRYFVVDKLEERAEQAKERQKAIDDLLEELAEIESDFEEYSEEFGSPDHNSDRRIEFDQACSDIVDKLSKLGYHVKE